MSKLKVCVWSCLPDFFLTNEDEYIRISSLRSESPDSVVSGFGRYIYV